MIWDMHCHLSGVDGKTPDARMAQLMEYADRMGIERLTVFMGMKWSRDPSPDVFRRENDEVIQALSHWHDRAFGFVYLNPKYVDECLKELDRCVKDGPMVGVKLWIAKRCCDKELDPIVRRAAELKAVIFQHTWLKQSRVESRESRAGIASPAGNSASGSRHSALRSRHAGGNLPGESTPMDLAELAARHPLVPFICGHTGGDWERGIRAVRGLKNVSIGTSGFDPTAGIMEMAVRELGADRIIYGSDAGGRSFASQLAKVHGADIPEPAKKRILGENFKRVLTPILKAKGIRV